MSAKVACLLPTHNTGCIKSQSETILAPAHPLPGGRADARAFSSLARATWRRRLVGSRGAAVFFGGR